MLAKEGGGTALDGLKRFSASYKKFDKLFPKLADESNDLLIKVSKFGTYASGTAKAMGKCPSECTSVVGRFTEIISSAKGISKISAIQSLNDISAQIKNFPIVDTFRVKLPIIVRSGCARGTISALSLDSCGKLIKSVDGVFEATPELTEIDRFKRLNTIDPAQGKLLPAEAAAAAQMEVVMQGKLERIIDSGKIGDFRFLDGPYANKSIDFMFTTKNLSEAEIQGMNAAWGKKAAAKISQIRDHMDKADYVVMDVRWFSAENRTRLLDYIKQANLTSEQIKRIIFIK